ncbi:response regulator transcription factor [Cochleicola gelatinilyticus]|uniref:Response regulatory domain-containing protein n=1 Tax=Cochleicola gelatinilyticus TaxID=1763537 RepID=A0A167F0U2_9FLAO|nr:response regulator transcription factor [Cochleicola gelatinilyticus]OAB76074.1 hypothetical protein ULVI_13530 [Cochleicola gelatinilyticus]
MCKKVLVIEDLDVIGSGILKKLDAIDYIEEVLFSQYCDEALLKFLQAHKEGVPFHLIITDLSFHKDHRPSTLHSGIDFISKLKALGYSTPIIVFSVEDRPNQIKILKENLGVSGYVLKDRNGLEELTKAIHAVAKGESYVSSKLAGAARITNNLTITNFDIQLLNLLASGKSQIEISTYLAKSNISPNSLSSIEKHLGNLKDALKARNITQLVAHAKDLGVI